MLESPIIILMGAITPSVGHTSYRGAFVRALKRAGGEIKLKTSVNKILLEDRKVVGLRLENGQEIRAKYVISNADPEVTFGQLIGREHLSNKLLRKVDQGEIFRLCVKPVLCGGYGFTSSRIKIWVITGSTIMKTWMNFTGWG